MKNQSSKENLFQQRINNNNIFELKSETTKRSFLELNNDTSSIQSKDHDYTRYKIFFSCI